MKYRIYQNMTEFACDVEADNEAEALEKARKIKDWDSYEANEDNITYDAVCQETGKYLTKDEQIAIAKDLLNRYYELCEEIDTEGIMSSSDLILYEDDFQQYLDGEIEEKYLEERIKNLKLFTAVEKN